MPERAHLDPLGWVRARDPGLAALRRACRTAVVMPAMFALGTEVIGNPSVATFAAFGSFATLSLVDFGGPMRDRLRAQAALGIAGALLVCLGTLASRSAWLAALTMAVVGFVVLFAGVVSSVLASASAALLLAFILPVSLAAPASSIPDRLAGWGMAASAAFLAVWWLWPAPNREPLRRAAIASCRALAGRLRSDAAFRLGGPRQPSRAELDAAIAESVEAVGELRRVFFATPYRPTGLSTAARTIVRLVDEVSWLSALIFQAPEPDDGSHLANRDVCAVKSAAASVLEHGADLLEMPSRSPDNLRAAVVDLHDGLAEIERTTALELPRAVPTASMDERMTELINSLDPGFRAQELSFIVSQIAVNIELAAAAERRSWFERMLGRRPAGLAGPVSAAHERAISHFDRHSVWLHNSVRGAIGLAVAVFVAERAGVQHSFWVVLGTLSVLRSNALSTGQNIVRGLLGTAAGFVVGAGVLAVVGTNTTVLWALLPPAVLFAGFAPAAISFAVGQAAFTLTLVILFNIIQPAGWRVGLVRVEDVALGCAVSLVVGLLFWPRGAASALDRALAEAYSESARYLAAAVGFGSGRCDLGTRPRPAPADEAVRAAAAARRLDDAFRGYLAERGAKPVPLAEVTSLVTGVVGLRLAGDAVLDLWERDDGRSGSDRSAACRELLTTADTVVGWYEEFAAGLVGRGDLPDELAKDDRAEDRLAVAVRHDLRGDDGSEGAVGIRIIWTGDHLDAARRLQALLVAPARAVSERHALTSS